MRASGSLGDKISVGNFRVYGSVGRKVGAVHVSYPLDLFFGFAAAAFGIVVGTEFLGGVITVFLQRMKLAGKATEDGEGFGEFFGSRNELLTGFGFGEEFGEMGGGKLQADFRELASVVLAEIFH